MISSRDLWDLWRDQPLALRLSLVRLGLRPISGGTPQPKLQDQSWNAKRVWWTISAAARWSAGVIASREGWNLALDVTPALALGDAVSTQVIAWYAFRARGAAILGWPQAQDQPAAAADEQPPSWVPTRPWARWTPQPAYGWTPASETTTDQPVDQRVVTAWTRWMAQPQYGWAASGDAAVTPQPEQPVSWQPVRAWKGWTPQPWLGWNAPADQAAALPAGNAVSSQVIAYYERWSAKLARFGWNTATDVPPAPALFDTPIHPFLAPFLFRWYRVQPQYGWAYTFDSPGAPPSPTITRKLISQALAATIQADLT